MKDIKDYKDYESLFNDDLVVAVREVLQLIEDEGSYEIEDTEGHNKLKRYFNKFHLHKKITKQEFESLQHLRIISAK